jgi:tetratricopeptide (TPR) repeat protein
VAAAGVALATATVALGISTAVVWTEKQKTDEARRQAEENLDALARMTNGIIDQTERELPPIPGTEVVRREILTPVQGQYRQMLVQRPADPAVREWSAKVERYVANLDRMVGEYDRANECYEQSVHLLTGLAAQFPDEPRHREKLSEAVRDYAELLRRLGNLPAADGATRRAVELAEPLHAAAPGAFGPKRTLGTALIERAEVRAAQGRWADAEADAGRAVALLVQLADAPAAEQVASDPVLVSLARTQLAAAQREQGRPADALRTHEAAVAGGEPVATDANAQYARARGRLERGRTLGQLGRPADRLADVTAAVGGFGGLAGRYPKVVRYREWLAAARNELAAGR